MTVIIGLMSLNFMGCAARETEATEVQVFIAASLNSVMTEIAERYQEDNPGIKIIFNADSSGKLMTQIEEGYACDIFFSAAERQMDQLEDDGFVIEGTREDVLNNQLVVISQNGSGTSVRGLSDIDKAESFALAGGSVPAGKYTRQAFVNMGILSVPEDTAKEVSDFMAEEVSDALGGVEISEQDNVSKVLMAVMEGSCEVGTVYLSDVYGHENEVEILEIVPYELTGNIIYPIARINNTEASENEKKTADDFVKYILSDASKSIFKKYGFDTNVN